MTTLTLCTRYLSSIIHAAAKADVRDYLVGIHINPTEKTLTATDGQMAVKLTVETNGIFTLDGDMPSFVIPYKVVSRALKGYKKYTITITYSDGEYQLNGEPFTQPYGADKYPDFERIVPTPPAGDGEIARVNLKLLAKWEKVQSALITIKGHYPYFEPEFLNHARGALTQTNKYDDCTAQLVIMPMRKDY